MVAVRDRPALEIAEDASGGIWVLALSARVALDVADDASRTTWVLAVRARVALDVAAETSGGMAIGMVIAIEPEAVAEEAARGTVWTTIRNPTETASTRLEVVSEGVTVPVPDEPAAATTMSETSVMCPVPVWVLSSERSVKVVMVVVWEVSETLRETPTTTELGLPVVVAGIVQEVVAAASVAVNDRQRPPRKSATSQQH